MYEPYFTIGGITWIVLQTALRINYSCQKIQITKQRPINKKQRKNIGKNTSLNAIHLLSDNIQGKVMFLVLTNSIIYDMEARTYYRCFK